MGPCERPPSSLGCQLVLCRPCLCDHTVNVKSVSTCTHLVYGHVCVYCPSHECPSRDNFFHFGDSGDPTQIVSLGSSCHRLLNHLSGLLFFLLCLLLCRWSGAHPAGPGWLASKCQEFICLHIPALGLPACTTIPAFLCEFRDSNPGPRVSKVNTLPG